MRICTSLGTATAAAMLLLGVSLPAKSDSVIMSWNLKHIGWGDDKRFDQIAHILGASDLAALQEVMDSESIEKLELQLEAQTGEPWASMVSHLIGRGRYQEAYSYLWRESAIEYTGGAAVFLDHSDVYSREPYSATFRSLNGGETFVVGNVHVVYGDSVSDRLPEIDALADYWGWLGENYPGVPRLLVGDMNLDSDHDGWDDLRALGAIQIVKDGATTLSSHNGRYANPYDQIWVAPGTLEISGSGKVRYPELLGIDHETARDTVSDHAPVWVTLGGAKLELSRAAGKLATKSVPVANDQKYDCVNLNVSSPEALAALPHIGEVRAEAIINGRPWEGVGQLTRIRGIGKARMDDIRNSGLLCD